MPYESDNYDNYYYTYWARLDNDGVPHSCWVKWDMNKDDFSMKVESEHKEEKKVPELLDFSIDILKHNRATQGYLTINDVLDIFDLDNAKLYDGQKEVNPYDIYCGDLDIYRKDMKELKKSYIDQIAESEDIYEIRDFVDSIHKIDKALEELEDCEECND